MSYFDHVQCHSCGAKMNPEQLVPGRGEMPKCPHCDAALNLTDLFGVKDSFVGMHDNEGNDHSLDDLLTNDLYDSRYADGRAPQAAPAPVRRTPSPARGKGTPSLRALTGAAAGALVRTQGDRDAWEDDEEQGGAAPSAADLLRSMKKRK